MEIKPARSLLTVQSFLVIGLAGALVWSVRSKSPTPGFAATQPRAAIARVEPVGEEAARIAVYRRASPTVVNISGVVRLRGRNGTAQEVQEGSGSGVIWDTAGHVVTNLHILEKIDAAYVTLSDGTSYQATMVGIYTDKDLAVLKINAPASKLVPVTVGTSEDLEVGQSVLAIGNPFGLAQTLTTGVISGLGREITSLNSRPIQDVIQTDAAINPGNSGGPLFDSIGRMIGVNTLIFSKSGDSAGIGFAIPIGTVNRIVPQLIATGRVTTPVLGVTAMPKKAAARLNLPGVNILRTHPGGPARAAGLRGTHRNDEGRIAAGDSIVSIDDTPIREPNDIYRVLDRHNPGDVLRVEIIRDGRSSTLEIKLSAANQKQ